MRWPKPIKSLSFLILSFPSDLQLANSEEDGKIGRQGTSHILLQRRQQQTSRWYMHSRWDIVTIHATSTTVIPPTSCVHIMATVLGETVTRHSISIIAGLRKQSLPWHAHQNSNARSTTPNAQSPCWRHGVVHSQCYHRQNPISLSRTQTPTPTTRGQYQSMLTSFRHTW